MRRVLVAGATSAIAAATCRLWAREGAEFFLVGRSAEKLRQVADDLSARGATMTHVRVLDLLDCARHPGLVDDAFAALGKVDVALVAHGALPDPAVCDSDACRAADAFAANATSAVSLLAVVAARMRSEGMGCVAVISSVAGDRGRPGNPLYGAAKAAVTVFADGLRARLLGSGVHVLTIKPGFVATPMTAALSLPQALVASPERVAKDIARAVARRSDVLYTPWYWRHIMFVIRHVPEGVFKRMRL